MSTSTVSPSHSVRPVFFVVAVPKLIIMTFFTFGLYWLFWYLRNWSLYRSASSANLMLLPRILWPEFFLYSLLSRVDRRIRASGRCYAWSPWWLTCGVMLASSLSTCLLMVTLPMPDFAPALMATSVAFYAAVRRVQRAINFCEGDPEGTGNAQLTLANWLWISVVTTGWLVLEWLS